MLKVWKLFSYVPALGWEMSQQSVYCEASLVFKARPFPFASERSGRSGVITFINAALNSGVMRLQCNEFYGQSSLKLIGTEISLPIRNSKSGHHTETNLPQAGVYLRPRSGHSEQSKRFNVNSLLIK